MLGWKLLKLQLIPTTRVILTKLDASHTRTEYTQPAIYMQLLRIYYFRSPANKIRPQ